jgi:Ca2+-binding RTX toxin-like protein
MRSMKETAALSATIFVLTAGTAAAATISGTPGGDALYGTPQADSISGYGGADMIRGYGTADYLYGGSEDGWGDKVLGGTGGDLIMGQDGKDALYGEGGDDEVRGGNRNDLVEGGGGEDVLDGGPGSDQINARDGQKDTIMIRPGEYDTIYYDKGLDVLVTPAEQSTSGKGRIGEATGSTASEAATKGKTELQAERPPEGLFEPHGKVLVEHAGTRLLVPEGELAGHLGHGDEMVDPTGRAQESAARSDS